MKTIPQILILKVPAVLRKFGALLLVSGLMFALTGCNSPAERRMEADRVATDIIQEQMNEKFSIERPSDILRRRLITAQKLPYAGPASLGTDKLEKIEHWPEKDYPKALSSLDPLIFLEELNKTPPTNVLPEFS